MKPSTTLFCAGLGVFVFLHMLVGLVLILVGGVVLVVEKVKESE